MKKLFLLLITCCAVSVHAQDFHFAPKVGMNIANVINSDGDSRVGLNVGFAGEMMLSPTLSVESGVFYSMQGFKYDDAVKMNLDYINIPILMKGYVYEGLNLFAGPQLGFKTNSKIKVSDISIDTPDGLIKNVDLGISAGIGYQFDMGLQLSASYTYGLIGIIDKDKISSLVDDIDFDSGNGHNSVIQINLGWRF